MFVVVLQKMSSLFEKLWATMCSFPGELSAEVRERERFKEQLQAAFNNQPSDFIAMDNILRVELEHRSAVLHSRKRTLQVMVLIAPLF